MPIALFQLREAPARNVLEGGHICGYSASLWVVLSPEKCLGQLLILIYLGFEFDTVRMEIRLPAEKLNHIQCLVNNEWLARESCTLESLLDELQHVSMKVRPNHSFLYQMIAVLSRVATQLFLPSAPQQRIPGRLGPVKYLPHRVEQSGFNVHAELRNTGSSGNGMIGSRQSPLRQRSYFLS